MPLDFLFSGFPFINVCECCQCHAVKGERHSIISVFCTIVIELSLASVYLFVPQVCLNLSPTAVEHV